MDEAGRIAHGSGGELIAEPELEGRSEVDKAIFLQKYYGSHVTPVNVPRGTLTGGAEDRSACLQKTLGISLSSRESAP